MTLPPRLTNLFLWEAILLVATFTRGSHVPIFLGLTLTRASNIWKEGYQLHNAKKYAARSKNSLPILTSKNTTLYEVHLKLQSRLKTPKDDLNS